MNTLTLPSRYTVLEAIGQGAEGRVFRVQDSLRSSELALKIVPPQLSHWLHREFEALRQIQHENLIRVFDWGRGGLQGAFYTMELVSGMDWGKRRGERQDPEEVTRILAGVLRGLAHLHSHGELHGDLKPENVLLGGGASIKLTDVGMSASTHGDTLSGTPGYAAPELWEGSTADFRSDIYSVGVMAYEAVTGRHPFAGRTIREVVSGQLEGWVPSPAAHGVRLPAEMERGIMRALERDPNLRPRTADEWMELNTETDRIGAILGGRFVARDPELDQFDALLRPRDPEAPTLLWVAGEHGVGKTALIGEASYRATNSGHRVMQVVDMSDFGFFRSPLAPTFAESETIWATARREPTMFVVNPPDDDLGATAVSARTLARHLHSIAREQRVGSGALIVCETQGQVTHTESFERVVTLAPLTQAEVASYLRGYLGSVDIQPEVVCWLCSVTDGLPGKLSSVITELVARNLLRRNAGLWRFREDQDLVSIGNSLGDGKRQQSWDLLGQGEQSIIAVIALMPSGLKPDVAAMAFDGAAAQIEPLIRSGWLRRVGERIQVASGEARRTALENGQATTTEAEAALLKVKPGLLSREEVAFLLVRNCVSQEALQEGLWAAKQARDHGDLRTAVERAKACLKIAEEIKDEAGLDEAGLILGRALHLLGRSDEAIQSLSRDKVRPSASREELFGAIRRSQGALEDARAHLVNAISLAERKGEGSVFLRSHAELAEVDWRHGDEQAREAAIRRIREALVIGGQMGGSATDLAALAYQLGAALIVTGKRGEAREILQEALAGSDDDYWVMRLTNALASAEYFLGEFSRALGHIEEAWRRAERGGFDLFKARIFYNRASIHYGLGKFRDAVEYHRLSAKWARRNGQDFEYLVACADEAVNLMYLGEYEAALTRARDAGKLAQSIRNDYQAMKSLETEALCLLLVGDTSGAGVLADRLAEMSGRFGYSDLTPRALMLKGMRAVVEGDWGSARVHLSAAERMLVKSRDWEDLPAVQIELRWVQAQEDPGSALEDVARIVADVTRVGALTVQLRGAFIIGEILLAGRIDDGKYRNGIVDALGRAGEAGASEDEWKLNYILGELCLRSGDRKAAALRFGQAARVFRSIAGGLSPTHRSHYLDTPHAKRLLARLN
jgi:serine/threonine protein kinase/tetratricopeptide (TPR) repeat protein